METKFVPTSTRRVFDCPTSQSCAAALLLTTMIAARTHIVISMSARLPTRHGQGVVAPGGSQAQIMVGRWGQWKGKILCVHSSDWQFAGMHRDSSACAFLFAPMGS